MDMGYVRIVRMSMSDRVGLIDLGGMHSLYFLGDLLRVYVFFLAFYMSYVYIVSILYGPRKDTVFTNKRTVE